jgi:hypothetical protein
MYPYLAAELHISEQRHQPARSAERHRVTHPERSQTPHIRTQPRTPATWWRHRIRPALTPAR